MSGRSPSDLADELRAKERALAEVTRQLERERAHVRTLTLELDRLRASRTVRYTSAPRRLYARLRVLFHLVRGDAAAVDSLPREDHYARWLARSRPSVEEAAALRAEAETLPYRPLISLVMPVFETDPRWLRAAVASVEAQLYDRWELCVADDGSTRAATRAVLDELAERGPRITVLRLAENRGISAASNAALAAAAGDFVGFVDHDDELRPEALLEVVRLLNEDAELDIVYTDEDKRSLDGRPNRAFFKPGWSPDLLLACNYVNHLCVFRRELVERVGGLRSAFDGSQDWDLLLRVTELTERIGHVPVPLYTWRGVEGSAARSADEKPWAFEAGARALADALQRRGAEARAERVAPGRYRVRYAFDRAAAVSIVVPTLGSWQALRRCIESVSRWSTLPRCAVVVAATTEPPPGDTAWLEASGVHVVVRAGDRSLAALAAAGAGVVDEADALVFLHDHVEVLSPEWLDALLEQGLRPEIGAVGPRLLHPGGRVEHEGVVILPGGTPAPVDAAGAFFQVTEVLRNVSAVSGACLATRSDVFRKLGFDMDLPRLYAADYCLRAAAEGLRVVYTPHASLYHHADDECRREDEDERSRFAGRWSDYIDPYYNASLSDVVPYALGSPRARAASQLVSR